MEEPVAHKNTPIAFLVPVSTTADSAKTLSRQKFQAAEQENTKLTDHVPTRIADEFQASRELRWIIIRSQKFRKAIVGDISDGCPDLRV